MARVEVVRADTFEWDVTVELLEVLVMLGVMTVLVLLGCVGAG